MWNYFVKNTVHSQKCVPASCLIREHKLQYSFLSLNREQRLAKSEKQMNGDLQFQATWTL